MKFSKKIAIFATVELFSLGGAAYTYDRYGVQDNSMILENVEALTKKSKSDNDNDGDGPDYSMSNASQEACVAKNGYWHSRLSLNTAGVSTVSDKGKISYSKWGVTVEIEVPWAKKGDIVGWAAYDCSDTHEANCCDTTQQGIYINGTKM